VRCSPRAQVPHLESSASTSPDCPDTGANSASWAGRMNFRWLKMSGHHRQGTLSPSFYLNLYFCQSSSAYDAKRRVQP